jgi:signal peptidase II
MRLVLWAAFAALVLDQVSKYLVVHGMALWRVRSIDVLPPVLNFRYGENRGINFGLFDGDSEGAKWFLILLSLVVVTAVLLWIRKGDKGIWMRLCAGLLVGGALGNVIDRVYYGYVLDFLNMSCCGIDNPFVFNVADIFIFAGAIGLIVFDAQQGKGAKNAP